MGGAKKRARAAPAAAAAAAAPKPATWHWCCDLRKTLDEKDASMWKKYGGTSVIEAAWQARKKTVAIRVSDVDYTINLHEMRQCRDDYRQRPVKRTGPPRPPAAGMLNPSMHQRAW
eukprot:gene55727-53651_t